MSTLTLNTPLSRTATSTASDVNKVRISSLVNIDYETGTIIFRYTTGRIVGASYIVESESNNIVVQDPGFTEIMGAACDDTITLQENIEAVLLQYLIDHGIVGSGSIA